MSTSTLQPRHASRKVAKNTRAQKESWRTGLSFTVVQRGDWQVMSRESREAMFARACVIETAELDTLRATTLGVVGGSVEQGVGGQGSVRSLVFFFIVVKVGPGFCLVSSSLPVNSLTRTQLTPKPPSAMTGALGEASG